MPVVIAFNTFTRNAGYLDASAIYIRARGISGQSIYNNLYPPDSANIFCAGYHFEQNTFTENINCPRYGGALIKLECVDYSDSSSSANMNDRIT